MLVTVVLTMDSSDGSSSLTQLGRPNTTAVNLSSNTKLKLISTPVKQHVDYIIAYTAVPSHNATIYLCLLLHI